MSEFQPLLLERRMSRRLWGGNRLAGYLGIEAPAHGDPFGEAWQVYSENRVTSGRHRGRTLGELAEELGESLLGTVNVARYGRRVPLLAKFIDASEPLSIQVHPDDAHALRFEAASRHLGKAEAWYVLDRTPGAEIVWGMKSSLSADEARRAVAAGELERHVNRVPVSPGDVVYNPPGTVHAIGGGIFLFEIQQASDLTYRLYDYGRRGSDGRERQLHLDSALAVANLQASDPRDAKIAAVELDRGRRLLIRSRHFSMEALDASRCGALATTPGSLELLTVVSGGLELRHRHGVTRLEEGASAVLPAALGGYELAGDAQALRCYVSDPADQREAALLGAGMNTGR